MEFVSRGKLEILLNTLLGISWSMVTFGTIFVLIVSLKSASIFISIAISFLFFFVFSMIVLFLESIKMQFEQGKKTDILINVLLKQKDDNNTIS
jgi:uncharacterized protein YacL